MQDYTASYTTIKVLSDATDGLVNLEALQRHGQERKTKLKNNFSGLMAKADGDRLLKLCQLLADKLPAKTDGEVVVGMYKSGIIMCGFLALARGSAFNWSASDLLGDYESAFHFTEDHRGKEHYIYGIKPGDNIIVIEDEVTSGGGVIALTKALRDFGARVHSIACVIETVNFKGRDAIREQTSIELTSLIQIELH